MYWLHGSPTTIHLARVTNPNLAGTTLATLPYEPSKDFALLHPRSACSFVRDDVSLHDTAPAPTHFSISFSLFLSLHEIAHFSSLYYSSLTLLDARYARYAFLLRKFTTLHGAELPTPCQHFRVFRRDGRASSHTGSDFHQIQQTPAPAPAPASAPTPTAIFKRASVFGFCASSKPHGLPSSCHPANHDCLRAPAPISPPWLDWLDDPICRESALVACIVPNTTYSTRTLKHIQYTQPLRFVSNKCHDNLNCRRLGGDECKQYRREIKQLSV
jgi:hypothetical protein